MFDAQSISALSPTQRDHQSPVTSLQQTIIPHYYTHSANLIPHSRFSLHYTDIQQLSSFSSSLCLICHILTFLHNLSFSFLLSLSWMGVNRQRLFNTMPTPSTHASHSIRRFSFETERLVSPSFSIAICLCALHSTAQHGTARHHKTPSPMLPLIPSNHPVNNPHD